MFTLSLRRQEYLMKLIFYGLRCSSVGRNLIRQGSVWEFNANRVWLVSRFYISYITFLALLQSASFLNTNCAVWCSLMQSDAVSSHTRSIWSMLILVTSNGYKDYSEPRLFGNWTIWHQGGLFGTQTILYLDHSASGLGDVHFHCWKKENKTIRCIPFSCLCYLMYLVDRP